MIRSATKYVETLLKSAWPHTQSDGPSVLAEGGCHKTVRLMCLETFPKEARTCNVCMKDHNWLTCSEPQLKLAIGGAPASAYTVFHIEFVHSDHEGERVAGSCYGQVVAL